MKKEERIFLFSISFVVAVLVVTSVMVNSRLKKVEEKVGLRNA